MSGVANISRWSLRSRLTLIGEKRMKQFEDYMNIIQKKMMINNKEDLQVSQMVREVLLFQPLPENQKTQAWSIYLH